MVLTKMSYLEHLKLIDEDLSNMAAMTNKLNAILEIRKKKASKNISHENISMKIDEEKTAKLSKS